VISGSCGLTLPSLFCRL